jgi:MFS transporter, SP family, sugar:H+ symporter
VCIAFVYFMIYETKGLTLEEVDELYETVGKAWQSMNFTPSLRFAEAEKELAAAGEGRHLSYAEMRDAQIRRRSVAPGAGGDAALAPPAETNGEGEVVGDEKRV